MDAKADVKSGSKGEAESDNSGPIFTLFRKLPPEMRDRIWKEHCRQSESRIIDLWLTKDSTEKKMIYGTHSRAPVILHASREARRIGLQHYVLLFEKEIKGEGVKEVDVLEPPHIYVNWDHDIIFPVPFLWNDPTYADGSLAEDNLELAMISHLTLKHQQMKRIAIPDSDTNWAIFLPDAKNISEIIVYIPKERITQRSIYDRFEKVEEASAAGIRFKIELVDIPTETSVQPLFPSSRFWMKCSWRHKLLAAVTEIRGHAQDSKEEWADHPTQPSIRMMYVELQELTK